MKNEEKVFGLGAGRLYIAPATLSEEESVALTYYVGPTKGGVTLTYAAKLHEITDYSGRVVRTLRYGERIRLEGALSRLYPVAISRILGGDASETAILFGGMPQAGRHAPVRATLVCQLPGGVGEMRFSMLAGAAAGAALSLTGERDSAIRFTLSAETDDAGFVGRMVFR